MTPSLLLLPNRPLDLAPLGAMLADPDDLKLVWPDAIVPFDAAQWRARLTNHPENTSYWVEHGGTRIGHAALMMTDEAGVMAPSYLYIMPAARNQGLGGAMMAALEDLARAQGATAMRLRVRDYNPRAVAVYGRAGYAPAERDGTLIIMRKTLA